MKEGKFKAEELWDWICVQIGFDEKGIELQEAIRKYVSLRIKNNKNEVQPQKMPQKRQIIFGA